MSGESEPDFGFETEASLIYTETPQPVLVKGKFGDFCFYTNGSPDRGRSNEDFFLLHTTDPSADCGAVGDGAGFYGNGGEMATILATELQAGFKSGDLSEVESNAHTRMSQAITRNNEMDGGASYVAWKITGNKLRFRSAGDVRLIVLDENGQVVGSTKDQHQPPPSDNVVWNCVSATKKPKPERLKEYKVELKPGYRIIIASDRVWKAFSKYSSQDARRLRLEQSIRSSNEAVAGLVRGKSTEDATQAILTALEQVPVGSEGTDDTTLCVYDFTSTPD